MPKVYTGRITQAGQSEGRSTRCPLVLCIDTCLHTSRQLHKVPKRCFFSELPRHQSALKPAETKGARTRGGNVTFPGCNLAELLVTNERPPLPHLLPGAPCFRKLSRATHLPGFVPSEAVAPRAFSKSITYQYHYHSKRLSV